MTNSPVMVEVDLWGSGRQVGHLRVPQSRDDSGWGTIPVPVAVVANGTGPTVLLTAGNHGDEYEGQVALLDLARQLRAEDVQGRVILLPAMHYPACAVGKRLSPLDGRDFNRCFPGDPFGGFAMCLAHFVDTVLLPLCDFQMDLHSGGTGMDILPSAVGHVLDHPEMQARSLAMAVARKAHSRSPGPAGKTFSGAPISASTTIACWRPLAASCSSGCLRFFPP